MNVYRRQRRFEPDATELFLAQQPWVNTDRWARHEAEKRIVDEPTTDRTGLPTS